MRKKPSFFNCKLAGRQATLRVLSLNDQHHVYLFRFTEVRSNTAPFLLGLQLKINQFGELSWGYADEGDQKKQLRDPVIFFAAANFLDDLFSGL